MRSIGLRCAHTTGWFSDDMCGVVIPLYRQGRLLSLREPLLPLIGRHMLARGVRPPAPPRARRLRYGVDIRKS